MAEEPEIIIFGAGAVRGLGLEVRGHLMPLLDGATGEPAVFSKAEVHGATYGQQNSAWHAMHALARPGDLKLVQPA